MDQSDMDAVVDPDPYLRALMGIGSELAGIRIELQKLSESRETSESARFACRCGKTLNSEEDARGHAVREHNAPRDAWQELMTSER